eukprot:scaffold1123_cov347-Prasinococcus_capsulatus_cf.AAC.9
MPKSSPKAPASWQAAADVKRAGDALVRAVATCRHAAPSSTHSSAWPNVGAMSISRSKPSIKLEPTCRVAGRVDRLSATRIDRTHPQCKGN